MMPILKNLQLKLDQLKNEATSELSLFLSCKDHFRLVANTDHDGGHDHLAVIQQSHGEMLPTTFLIRMGIHAAVIHHSLEL
jgi:hypothetical protein